MERLDGLARATSRDADHEALCLINNLKYDKPQPHLKASYVKYYFQAKKDYKEGNTEHEHPKGYGHGV
jgi:hypothetical protein